MRVFHTPKRDLERALRYWVDRAESFEKYLSSERQYLRARGVGTQEFALGMKAKRDG